MPLWGNQSANSASAPKNKGVISHSNAAGTQLYQNTTPGAFIKNQVDKVFGTTANIASANSQVDSSGWNLSKFGTGPLLSLTITAAGNTYAASDTITISGGTVNATAKVTVNANGNITGYSNLVSTGYFTNTTATTITITTSTGSGASLTPVLGGRAGRVQHECLVATGSMQ